MIRRHVGIILCILFPLAACTSHQLRYSAQNDIPLDQLINYLPAIDSVESTLIFNAILGYGQDGIIKICQQLSSEDHIPSSQAHWALHGLAIHVTGKGRETQREIYISGLIKALDIDLPVNQRTFILNQMQISGGPESVSTLITYIDDPDLYEPAIQALTTVGNKKAGEALLKTLPTVNGKQKVAIIQALGVMQYEPAGEDILPLLSDSDSSIENIGAFALSNIGYKPASLPLKSMVEKDHRYVSFYLDLAENLAQKGDSETCLAICEEILDNNNENDLDDDQIRVLSIFVKYHPDVALDRLFKMISVNDKKIRIAALNLLANYDHSQFVPRLISLAKESFPEVQSEIIKMFGKHKNKSALPFIRESLKSSSSEVRITALLALCEIQDEQVIPEIIVVLQDSLAENESKQIESCLKTMADSSVTGYLMEYFYDVPTSSKIVLLTFLGDRNKSAYLSYFVESLKSSDPELRMSALRGLEKFGEDKTLDELILFLLKSVNNTEKSAAIRAIASSLNRSTSKEKQITTVSEYYNNATVDEKMLLFDVFKAVGGNQLLKITVGEMQSKDKNIREAAIRTLSEWPDTGALDILIDTGNNVREERFRIIALRGALRILRENPMGDQRALLYYQDILKVAARPEEKRQILAGLAEIKTVSSLKLISIFLDDPAVNHEAFLAALTVSSIEPDKKQHLSREEIVISLVESQSDEELREKIKKYSEDNITLPQPPEGFKALFNGRNLDGWKGLVENPVKREQMSEEELRLAQIEADNLMIEHWQVIDGILYFDGEGSHLCTVNDYTDFELYVDWKIEKKGDSGIYLRGTPQVQIWDPAQWPEGSGGLYNNQVHLSKPLQKADNQIGEWNTFHIIMRGENVTVYLNDVLVVDNVVMENFWERSKSIYQTGQIELQSHNTPLYFRNIFIRELESQKSLFKGFLYKGKNLDGWQVIGNSSDSWQVQDNILLTGGKGGGWISTKEEFADFKLELEYRMPEGGNSGVFLRAPHQGDPAYTGLEIQILDDYADVYSDLKKWQYTGSIYGLQAPAKRVSKKAGEWQKMEILCKGPVIKVILNGSEIIDSNLIDFMHLEVNHPGIKRRKGYIGLQNHGTRMEFRNIYLMELK